MGKSIGEILREGRLHQRLSIAECAKRTHISPRYLEALEEERWSALPSESHRMGFLRLYAQFLGVYSEDLVQTYRQAQQQAVAVEKPVDIPKPARFKPVESVSSQRVGWLIVLALVSTWGIYHLVRRYSPESHVDLSWLKFKPRAPRLVSTKQTAQVHRINAKAEGDTWMRVTENNQLLFEGILASGAAKEWKGAGPFRIKIGNIGMVSVSWNDQPVDLHAAAQGSVAELKIPPSAE
jgi:cytoskeletal protein RodZ